MKEFYPLLRLEELVIGQWLGCSLLACQSIYWLSPCYYKKCLILARIVEVEVKLELGMGQTIKEVKACLTYCRILQDQATWQHLLSMGKIYQNVIYILYL